MKYQNRLHAGLLTAAKPALSLLAGFALLSLTACGGGGGAPVDVAPTAIITFPPAVSTTDASNIVVRGTAKDDGDIALVRVNGIDVSSSDNFATWQVTLPLSDGLNTLTVETADTANNSNLAAATAQVNVISTPFTDSTFIMPQHLTMDLANNRVLVADPDLLAVVAVNLATSERSILSDFSGRVGFLGIALDEANNRALVTGDSYLNVTAVDLNTGARTVLSDVDTPNTDNAFSFPTRLAVDRANNRVLVVDPIRPGIFAVDLSSGARTILSDNSPPNTGIPFSVNNLFGITVDSANNRALVIDRGRLAVMAVSLSDGSRTILSANTPNDGPAFITPSMITIDTAGNRALVSDFGRPAVIAVDLTTGQRSIVVDDKPDNDGITFTGPVGIAFNSSNNTILLGDQSSATIFAADPQNNQQVILSP